MRKRAKTGFTLIELILYISIVTIMLSALVPFAWTIIDESMKSSIQQEVSSSARYATERIKYEIRNANSINSITSTTLSLNAPTATVISLNSATKKVTIQIGAEPAVNLNSNDTSVSSLTFTNLTSPSNKSKHVQVAITVGSNLPQNRQEYQQTIAIETSAEVRSN